MTSLIWCPEERLLILAVDNARVHVTITALHKTELYWNVPCWGHQL